MTMPKPMPLARKVSRATLSPAVARAVTTTLAESPISTLR